MFRPAHREEWPMVRPPENARRIPYSYEIFDSDMYNISRAVRTHHSNIKFLYGIVNGAYTMIHRLHHLLGLLILQIDPLTTLAEIIRSGRAHGLADEEIEKQAKEWVSSVLILDDFIDSGKTAQKYIEAGFTLATWFKLKECPIEPAIWIREKESLDVWIEAPWEKDSVIDKKESPSNDC